MSVDRLSAVTLFAVAWLTTTGVVHTAWGEQLRIETDVYVGDDTEPVSHTVTLFDRATVYDFVDQPAQVAVFRPPSPSRPGEFILLNPVTKERTDISTNRIAALMKKLTRWAAEQEDPLLKFSAEPEFKETFDEQSGTLRLSSESWQYKVATVPAESAEMLARYREFTDWYTRLNTMMHGAPPPGPRLKLNASLQAHGVVPVEIHRTVDSQSTALRATHLFSWRLSRADRQRLDDVHTHLASFKKVENEAFLANRAGEAVVRGQSR